MKFSKIALLCTTTSLLLVGCGTTSSNLRHNYGEAADAVLDKQIVSKTAEKGAPVMHPEMVAAAVQRYLDDAVKEPEDVEALKVQR